MKSFFCVNFQAFLRQYIHAILCRLDKVCCLTWFMLYNKVIEVDWFDGQMIIVTNSKIDRMPFVNIYWISGCMLLSAIMRLYWL
jgi:hypothetical protein